jgi:hypothetical protein
MIFIADMVGKKVDAMVVAKHHKNDGGLDDVVRTCARTDARTHTYVRH